MNWFQIDQHNLIGTLTPQQIVDMTVPPPGNFVTRDPNTTLVTDITSTYLNLGNQRTEGIDFGFTYFTKEYDWGKLELQLDATYIYYQSAKTIAGINPNGSFAFQVENLTDEFETSPYESEFQLGYTWNQLRPSGRQLEYLRLADIV